MRWKTMLGEMLQAVYPAHCPFCGTVLEPTTDRCDLCRQFALPHLHSQKLILPQGQPLVWLACYPYAMVRQGILRMKFGQQKGNAAFYGGLLSEEPMVREFLSLGDMLSPVPISRQRRRERGFNQAEVMARELSDAVGIPYQETLKKCRHNPPQSSLQKEERHQNVTNVYEALPGISFSGKHIILLDDVVTTGATLSSCAEVLYQSGARLVSAVALAYGDTTGDSEMW